MGAPTDAVLLLEKVCLFLIRMGLLKKGKEMAREYELLEKICKEQEEILNTIFGDRENRL